MSVRFRKNTAKIRDANGDMVPIGIIGEGNTYGEMSDKVDNLVAVNETPTEDTKLSFNIVNNEQYDLAEESEIEEIKNDLEELESEVEGKASAESVQNLNASKLSKPTSGVEVGKYFRVASIDPEGNPVLEACDLPIATATNQTMGLIKLGTGFFTNTSGVTIPNWADTSTIDRRSSQYVINPNRIPYAVKSAMSAPVSTTDPEWTDAEKLSARQRIGLEKKFELIDTITTETEDYFSVTTEPNGTPYDFVKLLMFVDMPANSVASWISLGVTVKIGNLTTNRNVTSLSTYTTKKQYSMTADVSNGRLLGAGVVASSTNNASTVVSMQNAMGFSDADKIVGAFISNNKIPTGSIIKIYAIRA